MFSSPKLRKAIRETLKLFVKILVCIYLKFPDTVNLWSHCFVFWVTNTVCFLRVCSPLPLEIIKFSFASKSLASTLIRLLLASSSRRLVDFLSFVVVVPALEFEVGPALCWLEVLNPNTRWMEPLFALLALNHLSAMTLNFSVAHLTDAVLDRRNDHLQQQSKRATLAPVINTRIPIATAAEARSPTHFATTDSKAPLVKDV